MLVSVVAGGQRQDPRPVPFSRRMAVATTWNSSADMGITRAYVNRRTAEGRTREKTMRSLMRYITRQFLPRPASRTRNRLFWCLHFRSSQDAIVRALHIECMSARAGPVL